MPRNLIFALVFLAVFIAIAYVWARRRVDGKSSRRQTQRIRKASSHAGATSYAGLTAEQGKAAVAHLLKANAQWPQIITALNPQNDPGLAAELSRIRGPHMFVPHLALQVIHHGCEESIRANRNALFIAAATAARVSMEKVTRYGD